jgi:hypothetical protein
LTGKKKENRTIKLASGAIVDARQAIGAWDRLQMLQMVAPAEFRSLVALAQDRTADASPEHFTSLCSRLLLEEDLRTIRPMVKEVLQNSYLVTDEGPVIAPLRLYDAAELPSAEWAKARRDNKLHNFLFGKDNKGPSRE